MHTAPVMFNTRPTIPNALAKRSPPALVYQRPCAEAISANERGPFAQRSSSMEELDSCYEDVSEFRANVVRQHVPSFPSFHAHPFRLEDLL